MLDEQKSNQSRTWFQRVVVDSAAAVVRTCSVFVRRLDVTSHGFVPLFMWVVLLFGGIWFPSTTILNHVFNDEEPPVGLLTGNSKYVTLASDAELKVKPISLYVAVLLLPFCLLFWASTNICLLCIMASAMGEMNRCEETGETPNYRTACTRAFFVFLFVLLNELAVAGSLTEGFSGPGSYTRIAVLASLFSFVASFRPSFYSGLISKFSSGNSEAGSRQSDSVNSTERAPAPARVQSAEPAPKFDVAVATTVNSCDAPADGDGFVSKESQVVKPR